MTISRKMSYYNIRDKWLEHRCTFIASSFISASRDFSTNRTAGTSSAFFRARDGDTWRRDGSPIGSDHDGLQILFLKCLKFEQWPMKKDKLKGTRIFILKILQIFFLFYFSFYFFCYNDQSKRKTTCSWTKIDTHNLLY